MASMTSLGQRLVANLEIQQKFTFHGFSFSPLCFDVMGVASPAVGVFHAHHGEIFGMKKAAVKKSLTTAIINRVME